MTHTTSDIIDGAVRDNRKWEYGLYLVASLLGVMSVVLTVWSMIRASPLSALAGIGESVLIWPVLNIAHQVRKTNLMLQMLKEPLARAQTAAEAAEMLQRFFVAMDSKKRKREMQT